MTITLFHIIIPPVVASVSIAMVIFLFRHARKQRLVSVEKKNTSLNTAPVLQKDGSVAVEISQDAPADAESTTTLQKRIEEGVSMEDQIAQREKMLIKRIAANPRDAEAYDLLGQVYLVQGNLQDAAECFGQVITFNPRNLRAVEQLNKIKKITQNASESSEV